ncbi:hypothetical protein AC1031_011581 [Aphanomyces cochlioides]|nr:hypothetical protein AC1031_011581 [Aphanomyces cochlioides]
MSLRLLTRTRLELSLGHAALPFMKFLALAHCVRVGDKQLLETVARISTEDIPRVGELVAIAINLNQVDILASLECIGYTREICMGNLVYGIGDDNGTVPGDSSGSNFLSSTERLVPWS